MMAIKIEVDGYEVTIKARSLNSKRANRLDTFYFLNKLATLFIDRATVLEKEYPIMAENSKAVTRAIHDYLDKRHFYDDL